LRGDCKIVASLLGKEAVKDLPEAEKYADLLELRIDTMSDEIVKEVCKKTDLPVILTFRRAEDGGFYRGDEEERRDRILSLLSFVDFVDVELNSSVREELLEECQEAGVGTIVSYHDLSGTPPKDMMMEIVEESLKLGDLGKLAVKALRPRDVLRALEILLSFQDEPLCVISMGEIGKHSRVIAPLYGSVLTYGCVSRSAAEGQLHIKELRTLIEMLKPR